MLQRLARDSKKRSPSDRKRAGNRPLTAAVLPEMLESRILFSVPAGFQDVQIGTPTGGSASVSGNTINLSGQGNDLYGTSDAFHYVYESLTGNGSISIEVTGIGPSNSGDESAGLDLRSSLATDAANMFVAINDRGQLYVNDRTTDGGNGTNIGAPAYGASPPFYIQLTRSGSTVSAAYSFSGSSFITYSSDTLTLPSTVLIGLAVVSNDPNTLATGNYSLSSLDVVGNTGPTASVTTAPTLDGPQLTPADFTVTYNDTNGNITAATIDSSNLLVTGPGGYSEPATLVSTGLTDGPTIAATYSAPDITASGTYTVNMNASQVEDSNSAFVPAGSIGTFTDNADTTPPTATLSSAPTLTTPGTSTYSFAVTYSDDDAVSAATIENTSVIVTAPDSSTIPATLTSTGLTSGSTVVATYSISSPTSNGTYTVDVGSTPVTDLAANDEALGAIGTFTVNLPGSISGTVKSTGAAPLSGRQVFLDTNDNGTFDTGEPTTTTDSSGYFTFTGLAAGTYHVVQVPNTGDTLTTPSTGEQDVTVVGDQTSTANFIDTVPATGVISGAVLNVNQTPIGNATVFLDTNNNGVLDTGETSTTTNSSGAYSFTALPGGVYTVAEVVPAGDQAASPTTAARSVTLTNGATVNGVNFEDTTLNDSTATANLSGTYTSSFPVAVLPGAKATTSVQITNTGSSTVRQKIAITLVATTDGTLENTVGTIGTTTVFLHVKAGKSQTAHLKFKYPSGLAAGSYQIVAVIDSGNAVAGTNKLTNFVVSPAITIAPAFVDLTGTFKTVPKKASIGKSTSVSILVDNAGNSIAKGKISVAVYESSTPSLTGATLLGTFSNLGISIKGGGHETLTSSTKVPSTATTGTNYLLAVLNTTNSITESNTANNTVVPSASQKTTFS